MVAWLCLVSSQNFKNAHLHRRAETERGGVKRRGREGGMHHCRQNVIKCPRAPAGREKETGGGRRNSTFHRLIDRRLQNNIGVSRALHKYYNSVHI